MVSVGIFTLGRELLARSDIISILYISFFLIYIYIYVFLYFPLYCPVLCMVGGIYIMFFLYFNTERSTNTTTE